MTITPTPTATVSPVDLARATAIVLARTGLMFGDKRMHVLEQAVIDAASLNRCDDIPRFLSELETARIDSPSWERLIQALTVSETYFFRDADQMAALRTTILPALIAAHRIDRTLRIWSAGCSTGEEAYSLAILLQELIPDIEHWKIALLATDLNREVLLRAQAGSYRHWSFRLTDLSMRSRYFTPDGDMFALDPVIKRRVTFAYLNLVDDSYPTATTLTSDLDLILCRNVTIYLPQDVTQQVINRFYRCLLPGGWLVVGASEYHPDIYAQYHIVRIGNAMVYRKAGGGEPVTWPQSPYTFLNIDTPAAKHFSTLLEPSPLTDITSREVTQQAPLASPVIAHPNLYESWRAECADCAFKMEAAQPETKNSTALSLGLPEPETCLLRNPNCVYAYWRMARRAADSGRLTEARQWAERALKLDPLFAASHYLIGLVHDELGETDAAVASIRKALYLDPRFVLAHFSISALYQRIGRRADAARHRAIAVRDAGRLAPNTVLMGSQDMTAQNLLEMTRGGAAVNSNT